ncbi:MAG: serine/threonine protein kinase [Opitutae bacterium]|nr:serine/threonine protein kinase [Opitutae bacterium]
MPVLKSSSASPFHVCSSCGGSTAHPFAVGGVCLRCAGLRALAGEDFALTPPLEPAAPVDARPGELRRIGAYEIIDEIGRGGMGRVYAARQSGLGRIVALKALPDTGNAAGPELRFLREAQTAARLRHSHIVTVHDSGRADGHVFFTMDYVEGGDLAQRLRRDPLAPRAAAALLHKIAAALAYTHGEGVLHRDLKPSNILLDGDEPRLADFGLAAQLEPGGDLTAVTGVLGTPHYLAPEALRHGSAALTPASDLYALGVIAYEMLTGRTPFAGASAAQLPLLVEQRQPPAPHFLAPATPPDLETIVLKLLERDAARRYASAAALAEDLRRFLAGEPILAQPPSAGQRLARYARRHRAAFAAAAAFVALLIAATIVSASLALRARRAEQTARAEARTSKALADFLQNDLLAQASPGEQPDRDIRLRDVLDRAASRLEGKFADDPLLTAEIHRMIGHVYDSLGEYEKELGHLESTWRTRQRELGLEHPSTLAAAADVASAYANLARYDDAARLLDTTLAAQRRTLGSEHPDTLRTADARAANLRDLGKLADAATLQTETLAAGRRVYGAKSPELFLGLSTLGSIRVQQSRLPEAEALFREAAAIEETAKGSDHPDTLTAWNNVAITLRDQGKFADAATINERILPFRRKVLGPEHHDTLVTINNLGGAYKALGRLADAEALQRTGVEIARRTLGDHNLETLVFMGNLADTYRREGKLEEAATLIRENLTLRRAALGEQHPHTLIALAQLGDTLLRQGKLADAEPVLRESLSVQLQADPVSWTTAAARAQLGTVLARLHRFAEAEPLLLDGYRALTENAARIPALRRNIVAETRDHLVELYTVWEKPDLAAEWKARAEPK